MIEKLGIYQFKMLLGASLALMFMQCIGEDPVGPIGSNGGSGSETTNQLVGALVDEDGLPAASALVQLLDVRHVPSYSSGASKVVASPVLLDTSVLTDSEGKYAFPLPSFGYYNIYGESKDGKVVIRDSVEIKDTLKLELPADTIRSPGAIEGISVLVGQSSLNQVRVTMYIPGTKFLTKPAPGGFFSFTKVPRGTYPIIFDPTQGEYPVKSMEVTVQSGETTKLDSVFLPGGDHPGTPVVKPGKDVTVSINDTIQLKGSAYDTYGEIIKMEWDVGNTGTFVATETGDTTVLAPSVATDSFQCVFRATDDDSNSTTGTVNIEVLADAPTVSLGTDTVVPTGSVVSVVASTAQRFGSIAMYKWDENGDGAWDDSSATDSACQISVSGRALLSIRVLVRDDDGNETVAEKGIIPGTIISETSIDSTVVWDDTTTNYILEQDLWFGWHSKVTFKPGVVIYFKPGAKLVIQGEFSAVGNAEDSIVFLNASIQTFFIESLFLNTYNADGTYNNGHRFEYCAMPNGQLTVMELDESSFQGPYLRNVRIGKVGLGSRHLGTYVGYSQIDELSMSQNGRAEYCKIKALDLPEGENNVKHCDIDSLRISVAVGNLVTKCNLGFVDWNDKVGHDVFSLSNNNISCEPYQIHFRVNVKTIFGSIIATSNYWGPKVTAEMKEKGKDANISVIWDNRDDPSLEKVTYDSWRTSPVPDAGAGN